MNCQVQRSQPAGKLPTTQSVKVKGADEQMGYAAVFVLLLVIVAVSFRSRSRSSKPESPKQGVPSNVISMDRHRKAKQSAAIQPCSSCRKKNGKLIFYAQDDGSVVGLCKDCKVKAKKRDMMPL